MVTIWDRIRAVDRRVIYVVMAVILLLPKFVPLVLPLKVDRMTTPLYDFIENNINPGDAVWVSVEYGGVMKSEMSPTLNAVALHLYKKGARLFLSGNSADGAMFAQEVWELRPAGYEWGKNFVNFGFIAGYEAAVAALIESIPRTVPADFFGRPTAGMEIMEGIQTIRDIKLVYQLTGGGLGPLLWIRQVGDPYKVPIATCVSSSMLPSAVPYFETGQLKALLNGLVGAAEYEYLTGVPGAGTAGMAGQSLGHLYVIGIVLLGNLAFVMQRRNRPQS
jgi:hypothetical protein